MSMGGVVKVFASSVCEVVLVIAFAPILGWLSARKLPSDRMQGHPPKGRFRGVETLVSGSSWPGPPYRCPAVRPRRSERNENIVSRTAGARSARAIRGCASSSGSSRGCGSRALRIAPAAILRLPERHGGTFGNPGDGLLEQFQFSGSRQGLSAAVGVELAVEVVEVGLYGPHADEQLGGDLAVILARGYEMKDFRLPFGQGVG